MKIAVVGLWHLGCVTAACLAQSGHDVLAYDPNPETIAKLKKGQAPIYEPGLDALFASCQANNQLTFSYDAYELNQAEIVWITFDTPVDDNDNADVHFVTQEIEKILPSLADNTLVIISSQLPVGTTRQLLQFAEKHYPNKHITFAYSPENLRLGKAIDVFTNPDRVIVGLQSDDDKARIQTLLAPFTTYIIWMNIESAEMTKHAINAFLATSVVFINELASLCEQVGANARDVERGLKSEERIGPKAYLRPGAAIAGGTLARDVTYLMQIGEQQGMNMPFFSALLESNQVHKQWLLRKLVSVFQHLGNKKITTLGLTYKAGTNTLRRSQAIETCEWLRQQGVDIIAFDPAVKTLPPDLNFINIKATLEQALQNSDAIIITTEWPEFTALTAEQLLTSTKQPRIFDASGFLMKTLGQDKRIQYYSVGQPA